MNYLTFFPALAAIVSLCWILSTHTVASTYFAWASIANNKRLITLTFDIVRQPSEWQRLTWKLLLCVNAFTYFILIQARKNKSFIRLRANVVFKYCNWSLTKWIIFHFTQPHLQLILYAKKFVKWTPMLTYFACVSIAKK